MKKSISTSCSAAVPVKFVASLAALTATGLSLTLPAQAGSAPASEEKLPAPATLGLTPVPNLNPVPNSNIEVGSNSPVAGSEATIGTPVVPTAIKPIKTLAAFPTVATPPLAFPSQGTAAITPAVIKLAQAPAAPKPIAPGTPVPPPVPPQIPPPSASPAPNAPAPNPPAPAAPSAPQAAPPAEAPTGPEPQVLVSEVVVQGATGELETLIYQVISTRPGQVATRSQLQRDTNAIFGTGFFAGVRAEPSDTPLGVRVTFVVEPYPVLRGVQVAGNRVLTQADVDKIFQPQVGRNLNLRQLQQGIDQINKLYQDKGFILGQVVGSPQIDRDGTVTLQVAEGVVEQITPRFQNKEKEAAKGRTREYVITRELRTKPGDVLNRDVVQADLKRLFDLGLFEDVQVALEPGQDPRKVNVVLNVVERKTGSFSAGAGFSSAAGLFGTGSYQQNNLFGRNQKLSAEVQAGTRGEILFDLGFTDPWIKGDPYRTSYSANIFNRLTQPFVFTGGPIDINLPNGDTPRVNRLGTSLVFTRPLTKDPDKLRRAWIASAGIQYQRVSTRDGNLNIVPVDQLGNPLTVSGTGQDDLLMLQAAIVRDLRNDALRPTRGSLIRFGVEQSVPVGLGSILMSRVRGSYSYYIPVNFLRFSKKGGPQAFAFNVQAGSILGDAPPYEAFSLGGSNSVRGYGEGELGTGKSFVQGTAEYRFPLFNIVGGALFFDAATTFGTQGDVIGRPGVVRGKPGQGFGYGLGVRVNTPLGNIRIDYGFNDQGDSALTFGIGERF